jgi:hypothetical protein
MAILKNTTVTQGASVRIPIGTDGQRPAGENGMLRFNITRNTPEIFISGVWEPLYPIGSVLFFPINSVPDGWLKCNGAAISRTTYSNLFAVIGTTWGVGDGSTTFNVPDLRGEFLRGWDDGRGADAGRTFGSFQAQDWKGFSQTNTGLNTPSFSHGPVYMGKTVNSTHIGNLFGGGWANPSTAIGTAWDDSEIRPINAALLSCIKF